MARIPEAEIERLKSEIAVERLVEGSGIALKRAGKDLLARCPFHEDAEASLVVTPTKNLWHCFGCGAAGGPIDWVMKARGVSFRHAVELLRQGAPALTVQGAAHSRTRVLPAPVAPDAEDAQLLGQVIGYYHETLKASPEALAYLGARGIGSAEAVERFRLGYVNRTLGLRLPMKSRKAGLEIRTRLERLGIYRTSGHEHFNGSLVIPILDEQGNVTEICGPLLAGRHGRCRRPHYPADPRQRRGDNPKLRCQYGAADGGRRRAGQRGPEHELRLGRGGEPDQPRRHDPVPHRDLHL